MTKKDKIHQILKSKIFKHKNVTNVEASSCIRPKYIRVFFRYKTEKHYNDVRKFIIDTAEKNDLKYVETCGASLGISKSGYDYCVTYLKVK